MSEMLDEQTSALMDGEVDADARSFLLRRMADDDSFRSRWTRYHLISEALKNNLPEATDPAFSEHVRRAVAREPALIVEAPERQQRAAHRWRLPAMGIAAAASLAAVAVIGLQMGAEPDSGMGMMATDVPKIRAATTVALGGPQDRMNRRLQPYVQIHNGHAAGNPMRGYVPYVRLVSHDTRRR